MKSAADVVSTMLDGVKKEDAAAVLACIDKDLVCIEPASLPYGGEHRGLEAFKNNVLGVLMGRLIIKFGRCELLGSGDKVAASMDLTFTSRKTGNSIMMPYVEVYTCRNDKVVHLDVYPQDTQRLVEFLSAN